MNKTELLNSLKAESFSDIILDAFAKVKREDFVSENYKNLAYEDTALPLEEGATISQPYTIAFMLELLELEDGQKILEIGSGSGYVLALISHIIESFEKPSKLSKKDFERGRNGGYSKSSIKKGKIYGIEIIKLLAEKSKQLLKKDKKIRIFNRDGSDGLAEKAPFDRILISAAASKTPNNLLKQLKDQGIIVAPVNNSIFQIKKNRDKIEKKEFPGFVFVPLIKRKIRKDF